MELIYTSIESRPLNVTAKSNHPWKRDWLGPRGKDGGGRGGGLSLPHNENLEQGGVLYGAYELVKPVQAF